jgi:Tol biopolymer transport system component
MSAMLAIRAVAVAALVVLGVVAAPASATFPGSNGQITFFRFEVTGESAEIWRADDNGANQIKLTNSGAGHASMESDWSPSGSRVAFDSDRLFGVDGDVQIYTMDRNGGDVQQVTTGAGFHGDPAYSPTGTQLAIEADRGNYPQDEGIYIVPSTGGPVTVTAAMKVVGIPGNGVGVAEPQFSPNGTWITFTTFKNCDRFNERSHHPQPTGCTTAIYRVHPDGTGLKRLTEWGETASFSDWSPNGQWIAHDTGDNGKLGQHGGIWLMRPDGSDDHEIVDGSPLTQKRVSYYNNPVFSPDGTSMIFTHFLRSTSDLDRATATGGNIAPIVIGIDDENFQNRADWGSAPAG